MRREKNLEKFSFFEIYDDPYKRSNIYKIKRRKNISKIQKWATEIEKNNIKELKDIQSYLSEQNKEGRFENDARIIETILNCKQKNQKIYFNTNLFSERIHLFLPANSIQTKCLTNDLLNLYMIFNSVLKNKNIDDDFFNNSFLSSVKVISQNFRLFNPSVKGFIQDYDSSFSAISVEGLSNELIEQIVQEKPNLGNFDFEGITYQYFGNENVFFITKNDLSDEDCLDKFSKIKHLKNSKNGVAEGEKAIPYNNNLYYIDKTLLPERFCPGYWIGHQEIEVSFLFDFEIEYDVLFELIENSEANGGLRFPDNLCYWDTINYCFDFLTVLSLTSLILSQNSKRIIRDWCVKYYELKSTISKWKNNQLLLQRICNDFLNSFLNNSDFSRFTNLYDKVVKYIKMRDELKDDMSFSDVKQFFSSLPFATMINNQLMDDVFKIADEIESVLKNYISGSKPIAIVNEIRETSKKIFSYLPSNSLENVAFPFIVAPGEILGKEIKFNDNNLDPIFIKLDKNFKRIDSEKRKNDLQIKNLSNIILDSDKFINEYLEKYIKRKLLRGRNSNKYNINDVKKYIKDKMKSNIIISRRITNESLKFKDKAFPAKYKVNVLDEVINDYTKSLKNNKIMPKKNSQVDMEVEEEIKNENSENSEENEEEEKEDVKSEIITTRKKKKI